MQIGFAQVDITPPLGTPMCGQPFEYRAKDVESRLYARAMCLDDGQTTVLVASCDVILIPNGLAADICCDTMEATGVPAANTIVCATHTHSGPSTVQVLGAEFDATYLEVLRRKIVKALTLAHGNRVEGVLRVSGGELEGYAFNRRFLMSDGAIETHPLKLDPHIVQPEGPDSTALRTFHATDMRGEPLGAAVSFGCHATVMHRSNELISADFPGKVSEAVGRSLGRDTVSLFLQGACGNICQVNPMDSSHTEVGAEWAERMGRAIGERAVEIVRQHSVDASGPLRVVTETVEIPRRAIPPALAAWADRHDPTGAEPPVLSDYGAEVYGHVEPPVMALEQIFKTPFWADFYASEIGKLIAMREEQPKLPLTIKVVAQDNWAMVSLPCEPFVEWSQAICEASPFDPTCVVELANGWNGYIPTKRAFERSGGYETKEVTSTMLVPEAGDLVLDAVIKMLEAARA